MVGVGHATYTYRFHELVRLVSHIVTIGSRKIERNGSIKKIKKRGNIGEPSKDKNGRDDNRGTRTEKDGRGVPRNVNHVNARNPPVRACYECGSTDHVRSAYPRLNRAQGPGGNRPNQVVANNEVQGHGNQGNQARGRVFMLGAKEARQDLNIMTGTFTLNDYFATTLFDSGADYSFVSTTFIPLLVIEPSELGFRYEIKIASGQLVEINKVIKGCKLEIEGYVFDIDLLPFGHGSFDVIIRMDWLSNHKAEIICHEKVVRIPLLDGKVLRVLRDRSKEKVRLLMSTKASDKKQGDIVVVRDFSEDNSRSSKTKVSFNQVHRLGERWHVINGNGIHADPSKIEAVKNRKAPKTLIEDEEQELVFQTLKDKLCNALMLALLDGLEDFVVYYDASGIGLGCVLMQRELFSEYECEICYHSGKADVVADALSRKERVKPKRVRAMNMTHQSSIKDRIMAAQKEVVDEFTGLQKGLDKMIEQRSDGTLYYLDRIWVPLTKYSIHPRSDKMYYDLRDSVRCAPFEALYGRKCCSLIMWAEVGEGQLIRPKLVQETSEKISLIKDRLKAARDRQKSYADKRRKPLEFSVDDYVLLKVSPWKGVVRFRKKGKIAPRFVRPFEIIEKVGHVAYRLDLPEELNGVHDTFHVSNLKKCLADPIIQVKLDEILVDAKLNFMKEPIKTFDREFKKLKRSRIAIVKVRWNSKRGLEFTWEREDQMKLKYPHLFSDISG
nr:putative reverse transcriptase domain-containing protein [Tanacetum cinerariifolium]